jgi:glutamyl-tRNA synthetase
VGGARTALFNWLYARHTGGRFVLRFEDTDLERSTQQSVDAILDALAWLGIDWDDGPYFQSERLPVYREHLHRLLEAGHAYYCTCTPEEIEAMRKAAAARGDNPRYDGRCRERQLTATDNAVIRFKTPLSGATLVDDRVKGPIAFQNSELDDFIICRSDGMPMYNLAVVVDDITMGVNTIIRGDDHVNNTPKQILLYKALEASLPAFAHVPMVLGSDRARLSKRHGAMSVTEYREMGYLPDAVLNYLVRLGWSHGDQEFFTRQDLIDKFSLENIGNSAGIFDPAKLLALNAEHVRNTAADQLVDPLIPFLASHGITDADRHQLGEAIETLQARSKTLVEMAAGALFYFARPIVYEEKAAAKFLKPAALEPLRQLTARLAELKTFDDDQIEGAFVQTMERTGLKLGKIAQPVRVALSGKSVSPGIFEIIRVLGRDETLKRMHQALAFIAQREAAQG